MPLPEMRRRVWNPAVEGKDGEGGRESAEGHDEKSLSPACVGPFLFAQLRNQLLSQPRPLLPPLPFPFPPPFPPLPVACRPPAALPAPFLMVAAMMAAAPRPFHGGTFGPPPPAHVTTQRSVCGGPNRSLVPLAVSGRQMPKKCKSEECSTESAVQNANEANANRRTKKRKREAPTAKDNGESEEGEGEVWQQNAKKSNANPIVQMVMDEVKGNVTTTPVNFNTCAICGDQFRLPSDLIQHARTNHLNTSRYKRSAQRASIAEEAQRLCKE